MPPTTTTASPTFMRNSPSTTVAPTTPPRRSRSTNSRSTPTPTSQYLQDGLADLYFKIGRIREAVTAAQDQTKKNPDDVAAHTLLGKVYLRSLGDMQGPQSGEMLKLAIGEYPDARPAQAQGPRNPPPAWPALWPEPRHCERRPPSLKLAQSLDGNSEEAVLNMARLHTASRASPQQAIDALSAIPKDDRSARIDFALGGNLRPGPQAQS